MNQDQVKELLLQVENSELEFSVIFTGKKSGKVNGLYKSDIHEILLHNKNFDTDCELIYTAIHEYTHHRLFETEGGFYTNRVHSPRFWSKFHSLLEKAESLGLYKIEIENSIELIEITDEIKNTIFLENGKLVKRLGDLLSKARRLCKKNGIRYEDYVDRVLCLPRPASTAIEKMSAYDINPAIGYEAMKQVAKISSSEKREEAEKLFLANKSPSIVRNALNPKLQEPKDPRREIEKEKTRIEKTIVSLQKRLVALESQLEQMPITEFIFTCIFFTFVFFTSPIFAEGTTAPDVPDIPDITIQPGMYPTIPKIPARPRHPSDITQKKSTSENVNEKKRNNNYSNLDAKELQRMNKTNAITTLLNNVLNRNKQMDVEQNIGDDNVLLEKILKEIESLNSSINKKDSKDNNQSLNDNQILNSSKKATAEILKFSINNYDILKELKNITVSSKSDDNSFLLFADRFYTDADKIQKMETIYFLFKSNGGLKYSVTVSSNTSNESKLNNLVNLSPIIMSQTGNMIFWKYNATNLKINMVIRIN